MVLATVAFAVTACADSTRDMPLNHIQIAGAELSYIDVGEGEPVVFVHGALGDYRTWDQQIEPFAERYRVISYSRRYHYPNEWPEDAEGSSSVALHAEDLAELIKELGVGPVHLIGHSFGAFVALLTARDHPELVQTLTLGEPPVMSLAAETTEGATLLREFQPHHEAVAGFATGDDEEGVRRFIDEVMGENGFSSLPADIRAEMMQNVRSLKGAIAGEPAAFSARKREVSVCRHC